MTDIQLFNLNWLCYAMTAPESSKERYYYDGDSKKLFYSKPAPGNGQPALFNMVDLPIPEPESGALLERLDQIDKEISEIVEVPRLNVQDKVSMQLLFLSKLPGIIHEDIIRLDAEEQKDVHGFALDKILAQNSALNPMVPYWEDFKLKSIQYYLDVYTGVTGIALKLIQ